MKLETINLIDIGYTNYGGLYISLLKINHRSLFMVNTDFDKYLCAYLFFIEINFFDNTP